MKKKIILTDPNIQYRNTIKIIINSYEDAIVIAETSGEQELFNILNNNLIPDIIFMEMQLLETTGAELTKKILEKYPNIVIIGLSVVENSFMVDRFLRAGAKGYLLKLSNNKTILSNIFRNPHAGNFLSDKLNKTKKKKGKQTILVVDDFETNTYVIGLTLKNSNYHVIKAESGFAGLKVAENTDNDIDLIVADYNMPDMNGADMIKKIREIDKYYNIPALILSSDKSPEKQKYAEHIGISAWIQKPFQLDRFVKIIKRALK